MPTKSATNCAIGILAGSNTPPPHDPGSIALSDIVSALSHALDMTEAAIPGHSLRTCLLGMRIAGSLGMSGAEKSSLYYALLLKDLGCSSYAARRSEIVGGGHPGPPFLDSVRFSWTAARSLWKNVLPGSRFIARLRRVVALAKQRNENLAAMVGLRAKRGAKIAGKIGLSPESAEMIRHLDEHWDGSGHPARLRRERIPLGSRVMSIAQNLDVFDVESGPEAAMEMLRRRSGRWFDPRLVKVVERLNARGELWSSLSADANREMVLALDPGAAGLTGRAAGSHVEIDTVCEGFADVVDARSSFTYAHSLGVTRAAILIAEELGLNAERQRLVYRAALLHDIGKLQVPNSILDKPGKLDAEEWRIIREHPLMTQSILERVARFDLIAKTASQHHERLDGTGYPHGLKADDLSVESRVIAVADVYGALSEDRPYRAALEVEEIMAIMGRDVPEKLDAACFDALQRALKYSTAAGPALGSKFPLGGAFVPHAIVAQAAARTAAATISAS